MIPVTWFLLGLTVEKGAGPTFGGSRLPSAVTSHVSKETGGLGPAPRPLLALTSARSLRQTRAPASALRARGVSVSFGPVRNGSARGVTARARLSCASRAAGRTPRGSVPVRPWLPRSGSVCEPRRSSPTSDWFPEMLLPLLVPLLWLWSRTGAAPSGTGTEQPDSVVSFTPTLSGEVCEEQRE